MKARFSIGPTHFKCTLVHTSNDYQEEQEKRSPSLDASREQLEAKFRVWLDKHYTPTDK